MKKSIMKKWVKALRSGKYKQTKESLKDNEGFCCLGVLCDIYRKDKKKGVSALWKKYGYMSEFLGNAQFLPEQVIKYAGMDSDRGKIKIKGKETTLSRLNDCGNYSFQKIADVIEKKYKRL